MRVRAKRQSEIGKKRINMILEAMRQGDIQGQLACALRENGRDHAWRDKNVSFATLEKRSDVLYMVFAQLKGMGYKLQYIYNIKPKHIQALFKCWDEQQLSPSTLQGRHSVLKTFFKWIEKEGMLPPLVDLVSDQSRVRRSYVATEDRSWSAKNIDVNEKIREIAQIDPRVALQIELVHLFGLRVRESVMFKPNSCITLNGKEIQLKQGTKGGRPRRIPVETEQQRRVLARAQAMAGQGDGYVGDPTRTLAQNMRRFRYCMERVGISREALGVTPHGLRHQYANDRYEELSGGKKTPVRGGTRGELPPCVEETTVRRQVSQELGHARIQITTAYCGSHPRRRSDLGSDPELVE